MKRTEEKKPTEQLTVEFFRSLYRSADASYCVGLYFTEDGDEVTLVGCNLPEVNFPITVAGHWSVTKKYGKQFSVDLIIDQIPQTEKDLIHWIVSMKIGIGKTRANKLIEMSGSAEKFMVDIEDDPFQFLSVKGVTKPAIIRLQEAIVSLSGQKKLFAILGTDLHMDMATYNKVLKSFKSTTKMLEAIESNPFVLLPFGYSFMELDDFCSTHTNLFTDDRRRLIAAAHQCLLDAKSSSHSCLPLEILADKMGELLSKNGPVLKETITDFLTFEDEHLIRMNDMVYLPRSYLEETFIVESIMGMMRHANKVDSDISEESLNEALKAYEQEHGFQLSPEQSDAVKASVKHPFTIITGGPGTGKSTILDALLVCWKRFYDDDWLLMAPTGKAAVRISETTGQPASTIHSALGLKVGSDSVMELDSRVNEVDASLVVIDECSMLDQTVMASVMLALQSTDTDSDKIQHLVLVGDPDQLPSVGWGNVLADLIDSQVVPVTCLKTVHRQGAESPIIKNALKMQAGDTELDFSDRAFVRYHCGEDSDNMEKAAIFYKRCVSAYGLENVVLLSPYHRATAISTNNLNERIQESLNPDHGQPALKTGKCILRLGDRVMQLKNSDEVANGDVGQIIEVNPRASDTQPVMRVKFENGKTVEYPRDQANQLELAYAISIHKSQGSQYPVVIVVMPCHTSAFLKRNLIYTAITRSSKNVAIFSPTETIRKSIENNQKDDRYTQLALRLRQYHGVTSLMLD